MNGARRARRGSLSREAENPDVPVVLPEPFTGSTVEQVYSLKDVPTSEALAQVLQSVGISTADWGKGNTKDVSKYWKEIKEDEAGLEVWKKANGELVPVRVTHVLRAKVSSPDCYERGVFLFNTWQQYGDGRKRIRNGLLSEKLTLAEMPLSKHLKEVCRRAVTEEEMQRVVDSAVKIGPGSPAPEYDPDYKCPLQVVGEEYVDHTVEIEHSKSYPGLVTVYHLYTVDIICEGLPSVDFNTLEFEHPDKEGKRKLKYIHAWVWLQWASIQRYLFEGSEMKERKGKGSFKNAAELEAWLSQFDLRIEDWGKGPWKPVSSLFAEVEREETLLEHWGRQDGVPLLMRVVHVLQCKVTNTSHRSGGKFLFQVWQQSSDGRFRTVNRPMAKKISTRLVPFDEARFAEVAKETVQEQLSFLADVHIQLRPERLPAKMDQQNSGVAVVKVEFLDHRFDLESSPSYKDMTTMYHLYTVEVQCTGLPVADFASLTFNSGSEVTAFGWRWVTWQQTLDILHALAGMLERRDAVRQQKIETVAQNGVKHLDGITKAVKRLQQKPPVPHEVIEIAQLADMLQEELVQLLEQDNAGLTSRCQQLPPSMVASLADRKLVSDNFLDEAQLNRLEAPNSGRRSTAPTLEDDRENRVASASSGSRRWFSIFCGCGPPSEQPA